MDLVHDIQSVYRKVLNSMARPGIIERLEEEKKVDIDFNCNKGTFLLMLMLLDGEVSFKIVSKRSKEITELISQITYSKEKSLEEADYIFVLEDALKDNLSKAYKLGKIGTLIDPNKSATIIAEVDHVNNNRDLELLGPGIKGKKSLCISGNKEWIKEREIKNKEYPLGIDGIFIDKECKVVSIPRTTKIITEEE